MAQYQHLPIYKATYELLRIVTQATSNFPRAYKYSLGDKLREEVVEMVVFVFKANSSRGAGRAAQAALFLERLQVVELTSINLIERGFDALGYVVRPCSRYLRRATVRNGFNKIVGLCRARTPINDVRQVAHSYFGIFSHANSWKEQGRLCVTLHGAGYGAAIPSKLNDARLPL